MSRQTFETTPIFTVKLHSPGFREYAPTPATLPLVQRQAVSIPPAVTIVAIILLGVLLGPLGMALAMPLTAVLFVLVKELYLEPLEAPGAHV